jgi:predicted nucleic acid-binding protein
VNLEIAQKAARLIREYKTRGIMVDLPDATIASTCVLYDLVLVTLNKRHYPFSGMKFHSVSNP